MTQLTINAATRSHVGLVRERNEDAAYVGDWLFAVADGLGGHVAGDVASSTAIDTLRGFDQQIDDAGLADWLGQAVRAADRALQRRVEAEPDLDGMGTTLGALLWSGRTGVLANVGDSRAYLLRGEGHAAVLTQITEDHLYGHLVADAADVPNLPERLARYLDGRTDGRSPDLTAKTLRPGDRLLLCSDGLSSYVPAEEIHSVLVASEDAEQTAEDLVSAAIEHGGHDNVTVVVIDVR